MFKPITLHLVLYLLQASNHLLGPKPFPLDRLLAIFYSIVEGKVAPTAIIYSQVGTVDHQWINS